MDYHRVTHLWTVARLHIHHWQVCLQLLHNLAKLNGVTLGSAYGARATRGLLAVSHLDVVAKLGSHCGGVFVWLVFKLGTSIELHRLAKLDALDSLNKVALLLGAGGLRDWLRSSQAVLKGRLPLRNLER